MFARVVFGLMLVPAALPYLTWTHGLYGVMNLTVVRVVPIILSLSRSAEGMPQKAFLAWFGPRGLASLAFAQSSGAKRAQ